MKKLYFFLLLGISSLTFGQAPLLVEDFNYTVSDALTAHGWSAHSGGTTNPVSVTTPGLTFTGYVGSNIGLAAGVNNTGQDVNKSFGAQTSGSIYASFLVSSPSNTATGSYFFHFFDPNASTAFRARTFIKPKNNQLLVGLSFNASIQQDSLKTLLNFGQTYLFVVKYKIVDGALNDSVSLYVFAEGDNFTTEPAKPTLGPLPSLDATVDIVPTCVALRQWDASQRITVDGIRVKTRWQLTSDVANSVSNSIKVDELQFYPNPVTNGFVNFADPTNSVKQIEIFDVVGKKVFAKNTSLNNLDVSNLKTGVYSMKVQIGDNVTSSKLVVK
jgi:hypothetical protein